MASKDAPEHCDRCGTAIIGDGDHPMPIIAVFCSNQCAYTPPAAELPARETGPGEAGEPTLVRGSEQWQHDWGRFNAQRTAIDGPRDCFDAGYQSGFDSGLLAGQAHAAERVKELEWLADERRLLLQDVALILDIPVNDCTTVDSMNVWLRNYRGNKDSRERILDRTLSECASKAERIIALRGELTETESRAAKAERELARCKAALDDTVRRFLAESDANGVLGARIASLSAELEALKERDRAHNAALVPASPQAPSGARGSE
jgi:hypothetical protein